MSSDTETRKRRLHYRAWHRGTKEADLLIGGFVDSRLGSLAPAEIDWLEGLLEENDVDIMAWMMGTKPTPPTYDTPLMAAMQKLDFVPGPDAAA
jgi:antitoxin CptB